MAKTSAKQRNGSNGDDANIKLSSAELEQIGLAIPKLRNIIKSTIRLHAGLEIGNAEVDKRAAHATALEGLVKNANGTGAHLPRSLHDTAVVGLRHLRLEIEDLIKDEVRLKQDPEPLHNRLASLDRLGKKLGAQLVMVNEQDEKDAKAEKQGQLEMAE